MESIMTYVAATRDAGAAFLGVRSAWTSLSGVGTFDVRTQTHVLAAGIGTRAVASRPVPATPPQLAATQVGKLHSVNETRKQQYVHKTPNGAGGNGAMGPYPERESAY